MKKVLTMILAAVLSLSFLTVTELETFAEIDKQEFTNTIVTEEVNIGTLTMGEKITIYSDANTTISIELVDTTNRATRASGDSGWSGGSIPWGISTLNVKCQHDNGTMQYKIDVRGSDSSIVGAYNLTYNVGLWSVQNTNLSIGNQFASNYTPAYATATITAHLIQYGIVVGSFGGYLTSEINSNG